MPVAFLYWKKNLSVFKPNWIPIENSNLQSTSKYIIAIQEAISIKWKYSDSLHVIRRKFMAVMDDILT